MKIVTGTLACIGMIAMLASFTAEMPPDKAELGKMLFFDPILSRDRSLSCASCHKPEFGFADTAQTSLGVKRQIGTRNTPSAMNLVGQKLFFWDGRAKSLQEQALMPIENVSEMNLPIKQAIARLRNSKRYQAYFNSVFHAAPNRTNLGEAIAAFEKTLETSESPFDNWKFNDDTSAVSAAVRRGFDVFNEKGKCSSCHFGSNFTQNEFRNIGLFNGTNLNDSGRAAISKDVNDLGKFKTPGLRNIAITSPYMHNGMFRTLREVIDFYNDPRLVVPNSINRDSILLKPLGLSEQEKGDLEQFLLSLTDKRFRTTK